MTELTVGPRSSSSPNMPIPKDCAAAQSPHRLDRTASTILAVRSTLSGADVGRSYRCQVRPLCEPFGMVMVVYSRLEKLRRTITQGARESVF